MENFLEKFSGTIQSRQVQQVLKKLNVRRANGEFQNSTEFQQEFEKLIERLVGENLEPSLIVYPAFALERTDTEEYNDMLEGAYNSLQASYEELGEIEKVQTNHQNVIKDVILKNINLAINELKTKLNLYKFVNKNPHGFEDSVYSTFDETKVERVNRGSKVSNSLFVDQKTKKVLGSSSDAEIDPIGEALQLNISNKKEIPITKISQEFGGDFKKSLFSFNNDDAEVIGNIIDSTYGTYWKQTIRRPSENETVKVKLVLNIGGTREINYLEIDPVSISRLDKIDYVDSTGAVISILEAGEERNLKTSDKVVFSKISTNKLYLEFTILENESKDIKETETENFNAIASFAPEWAASDLLELLSDEENKHTCYEYKIGIDNIRIGLSEYEAVSLYTSKGLFMKEETGLIGLLIKERRPYLEGEVLKFDSTLRSSKIYLSSLEYWVIKEDLDSDTEESANILKTSVFPIFPIGTTNIYHERLVLTESSLGTGLGLKDTGELMHFPDTSTAVSVYRNGTLMASGYTFPTSNSSPQNGSKMNYKIKVETVNPGDIFTVSYLPLKGNSYSAENATNFTNIKQVDLTGDLTARVGPEGVILLDESPDKRIESYRIYLMVILRQNTARRSITSFLDEYRLSIGKRDLTKFEGTP